jgi:hypothetical protein
MAPLTFKLDFHDDPFEEQLKSFTDEQLNAHLEAAVKKEDYEQAQIIQNEINSRKNGE